MNCLTFSIRYKREHVNVKIRMEHHLVNIIKKHGVEKALFRYFRCLGFADSIRIIFEPHFYIVDGDYRIDYDGYGQ